MRKVLCSEAEGGRHVVSKIRRAVSKKTAVENSKRSNIAVMREIEDSQSEKS